MQNAKETPLTNVNGVMVNGQNEHRTKCRELVLEGKGNKARRACTKSEKEKCH